MADYGIKSDGLDTAGNSYYVFDSTLSDTKYLGVSHGGAYSTSADNRASIGSSASEANPITLTGYSSTADQLIFARPSDITTQVRLNPTRQAIVPLEYLILTPINNTGTEGHPSNINGTNYGIQVLNQASDIMFDSRRVNLGFEIVHGISPAGTTGGKYDASDSTYLAGNLIYTMDSSKTLTDWRNTYVSVESSVFFTATVEILGSSTTTVLNIGGFIFDNTNYKIYHEGYYETVHTGGITAKPNVGSILIGELKA